MKKIVIIGGGLAPCFNESMANQMYILSRRLKIPVITCNDIGWRLFKKIDRYLILNTRFIMNKTPVLSFINGAVLYAFMKLCERRFDLILIPGGIESEFLRYLNPGKCIPIITAIPFIDDDVRDKIRERTSRVWGVIVQSEKTRNQLLDFGVGLDKIILMHPLIDLSKFRYSDPPPLDEFRVLFASSPNLEVPGEDNFRDKGLPLLLEAFKEFSRDNNAKLYVMWRGRYNEQLSSEISELGLEGDVKVFSDVVTMPEMYARTHVTVIPFLNLWRSPEIPMSALESLACGRPVVATDVGEIADVIREHRCGLVSKHMKNDFSDALKRCCGDYALYQRNCGGVVDKISLVWDEEIYSIFERFNADPGRKSMNIGIATLPIPKAAVTPLLNIVGIMSSLSEKLYVITGNEGVALLKEHDGSCICSMKHSPGASIFTRVVKYVYLQLRISFNLARVSKDVDLWLFFGGGGLLLPMITAKLLGKDVILSLTSSPPRIIEAQNDVLSRPLNLTIRLNYRMAKKIVVYSENIIREWNLEKYRNKISTAHEHFLDPGRFKITREFSGRGRLVGYIGRLSKEKGVLNFVEAISLIPGGDGGVNFLVCGDGQLRGNVEEYLDANNLKDKVTLAGWIPHDRLSDYLNELRLLVLPSYTEGLPNILLETMACGTPVLATSIGAIPDIIKDEETGFILGDNSPECIAKNVVRALEHPNLEEIAKNARKLVEERYTYEATVERYKTILDSN